jgi:serine/threonine protein kinase
MAENYTRVFQVEYYIVRLYNSKKLRILLNSLDSLENCVRDTEVFLLECKRARKLLALQLSVPLRYSAMTRRSKFDHLIGELRWNLDKIQYTLCVGGALARVEWEWCTIRCRYVLTEAGRGGVDHEGTDIGESRLGYRDSDRDSLSHRLEDRSIFAQEEFLTIFKPSTWFAQNGSGGAFGEILKKRLCTERCISPTNKSSSIPVKNFQIDHLELKYKSYLNHGQFKTIYKGEWYGQEVAIAVIVKNDDLEYAVKKEARFLLELQHLNIVAVYGYSYTPDGRLPGSKETKPAGSLVMELMEGDLSEAIENRSRSTGPFSISVALDIMLQIVEGMVYLHEQDIMHRDLKPKNCLVKARSEPPDVYYTLKLADFGSAREMDTECTSDLFTVNPGTIRWMAPEMLGDAGRWEKVKYTKSVDVYGFAIISYQVVTGEVTPLREIRQSVVSKAVRNGARPSFPSSLSCPEALKQLIINCWHGEPDFRPNFVDIRERLWTIRKDVELGE